MPEADDTVALVARQSYGRLLSYLSARSRDVARAEDALSDAFVSALRTWPTTGIPSKPEGWLLQAARRRLLDQYRRARVLDENAEALRCVLTEAEGLTNTETFPDERLKLLFVCAHPAIDRRLHTPLMLQVVLGLDATAIGAVFLCSSATMGQRLVRAKSKIRDAGIAFEIPTGCDLLPRLSAVLEAIYAAYTVGADGVDVVDLGASALAQEAVWLARTVVELMPHAAEALGLLALLEYCEARRPARRSAAGDYVPMSRQDTNQWNLRRIAEAERLLLTASRKGELGRFQLEAAIQSAHVERLRWRRCDWHGIALLYEGLVRVAPTCGALLGRAVAAAEAFGPERGLRLLEAISEPSVRAYQPYWAARAYLLRKLGMAPESAAAYRTAIALTSDRAVRSFLQQQAPSDP